VSSGEEDTALDRTFRTVDAADYRAEVRLRLQPGTSLNRQLDAGNPLRVLASSTDSTDPRERPGAAVDGNARTGWVAKAGDRLPSIEVTTAGRHRINGIALRPIEGAPTAAPTRVQVTVGSQKFVADVPDDGRLLFPTAVRADSVSVAVLRTSLRVSTDSMTGRRRLLPVGIGELQLLGPDVPAGRVADGIHIPCGAGPRLLFNGAAVDLSLAVPAAAALRGEAVGASGCGSGIVPMAAGTNRIRVEADQLVRPESLTLRRTTVNAAVSRAAFGSLQVRRWSDTRREVHVSTAAASFLSVAENANAGWSATLHGKRLQAVTLDGWHQGWLIPAGSDGVVHLVFGPQPAVIGGLALGALAIVVLLVGALPTRRPGRRALPALGEATPRPLSLAALAFVGLTAAGGLAGAVVVAVALALQARLGPRLIGRTAILAAVPLLLAGVAEAIGPVGSARDLAGSSGVQLLCLLGLALLVMALLPAATPRLAEAAEQGALDEVEGERGEGGGRHGRDQEEREEVAVEDTPVHTPLDVDE
jgi:arabinofuranan 3-O-arabinosyltransferase